MSERQMAPYGAWESPISADMLAEAGVGLGWLQTDGDDVYWVESRSTEGGRYVIVRRMADGTIEDVTSEDFNARTLAHEYGGGMYCVHRGVVFFSNLADQRLYRQEPGGEPVPITPEPDIPMGLRYADGRVTPDGNMLVCVRETHREGEEAQNELVVIPTDGSAAPQSIASGRDFYSSPRLSPDGSRLAWLVWDHPNMPWDGTEVWTADLGKDGTLSNERRVAGGPEESIFQPGWSGGGILHFISDRSNWWNLYREANDDVELLAPMEGEMGQPQWVFGFSRYSFLPDGGLATVVTQDGFDQLVRLGAKPGEMARIPSVFTDVGYLHSVGDRLWFVGGSPAIGSSIVSLGLDGKYEIIKQGAQLDLDAAYFPEPESIEFPTEGNTTAHAFYYPPTNPDFTGPDGDKPPLLVISHGGPTSATRATRSLSTAYWTSRGFGVVDVNYGGSTGYGRDYRTRLNEQWGIVDVQDCMNAAKYLAARGDVDAERIAVRGGSAGGYTTLVALTQYDFFAAGASYYGVADLEALALHTHKFESRYLDSMVGPYPEAKDIYVERSPVHYADQISCPMIILQGSEDKVVPQAQAEMMVEALEANSLPYAYLLFEGEQHGFRQAATIKRAREAELYFYGRIFDFDPAGEIEPVEIKNLT